MWTDGGETFGEDELSSVGVRGGGRLLDEETVFIADAMPRRPSPEFAHRRVVVAETPLGVDWDGVRPAGLGVNQEPVPVCSVFEQSIMIVNGEIAQGLAKIMQETVAHGPVVHDGSRDDGQERQQIVTAPAPKLLA